MTSSRSDRLIAAVLAGIPALLVNMSLLAGFDAVGIRTAHGGLLRLVLNFALKVPSMSVWIGAHSQTLNGGMFQQSFHFVIGLGMAAFYPLIEARLKGSAIVKGSAYALLVWLVNALVVLPAIGEGIAGSVHLGSAGILCFAVAHTSFFLVLAICFDRFSAIRSAQTTQPSRW